MNDCNRDEELKVIVQDLEFIKAELREIKLQRKMSSDIVERRTNVIVAIIILVVIYIFLMRIDKKIDNIATPTGIVRGN
jgi:hypothetical protein